MDIAGDVEKEQKLSGGKHTETKKGKCPGVACSQLDGA